jgi:glutathione S-transferase
LVFDSLKALDPGLCWMTSKKSAFQRSFAMNLKLYAHPFSSYCQKALIALYENDTPFEWRVLTPDDPATRAELAALWPLGRMPMLRDGERTVVESSIVIEYLDQHYPGEVPLIPVDPDAALEVRTLDRFFDNYVHAPMQKIVHDSLRAEGDRDRFGVGEARKLLDTAYAWLDLRMTTATGSPATVSVWPIAPPLRPCSTPTGRIRLRRRSPRSRLIGSVCWHARRSRAPSTRRVRIASGSRSARPIATELPRLPPVTARRRSP